MENIVCEEGESLIRTWRFFRSERYGRDYRAPTDYDRKDSSGRNKETPAKGPDSSEEKGRDREVG